MAGKQYSTRPGTPGRSHAPPPTAPLTTWHTMGLAGVMATPSQFVFLEQSGRLFSAVDLSMAGMRVLKVFNEGS